MTFNVIEKVFAAKITVMTLTTHTGNHFDSLEVFAFALSTFKNFKAKASASDGRRASMMSPSPDKYTLSEKDL